MSTLPADLSSADRATVDTMVDGFHGMATYDNQRLLKIEGLSEQAQQYLLTRLPDLPDSGYLMVTLCNSKTLPLIAWQQYGGAGFFMHPERRSDPYIIGLMVRALRNHPAWHRAHQDLATNYLRYVIESGQLAPETLHLACRLGDFGRLDATLLACSPQLYENHVDHLHTMTRISARNGNTARHTELIENIIAKLDAATARRDQLFREVWLPALIAPEEYERVRQVPVGLLTQLYAAQYAGGYAAYHAARSSG